jgi:hypothetical protein
MGNINEIRETLELEIAKRIAGTSIKLQKMNVRTLWRGSASSEVKEESANRVRAGNVGTPGTLG